MRVLACIASMLWCLSAGAEPATRYAVRSATVTGLLTLDGYSSAAVDINDAGTIVGWTEVAPDVRHAFVLSGGLADDIGAAIAPKLASEATAINAKGQVVGFYMHPPGKDGIPSWQGFRWTDGVVDQDRAACAIICEPHPCLTGASR